MEIVKAGMMVQKCWGALFLSNTIGLVIVLMILVVTSTNEKVVENIRYVPKRVRSGTYKRREKTVTEIFGAIKSALNVCIEETMPKHGDCKKRSHNLHLLTHQVNSTLGRRKKKRVHVFPNEYL